MKLIEASSLYEFFHKELASVVSDVGDDVKIYVTKLLIDFASNANENCVMCVEVLTGGFQRLRKAGDESLFMSGFYRDYVSSGPLPVDYYVSMGSIAYSKLSKSINWNTDIYSKLSHNMKSISDSLWKLRENVDDSLQDHSGGSLRERFYVVG